MTLPPPRKSNLTRQILVSLPVRALAGWAIHHWLDDAPETKEHVIQ